MKTTIGTDMGQISYESDTLSPTVAKAFRRHLDTMQVQYEVSGDGTYTIFLVSGSLTPRQLQHILRLEEFCIARNLPVTNVPLIGELKI